MSDALLAIDNRLLIAGSTGLLACVCWPVTVGLCLSMACSLTLSYCAVRQGIVLEGCCPLRTMCISGNAFEGKLGGLSWRRLRRGLFANEFS